MPSGFVSDSQARRWIFPTPKISKSEVITGQSQLYPHFCQPSQSFLIFISGAAKTFPFFCCLVCCFCFTRSWFQKKKKKKKTRKKAAEKYLWQIKELPLKKKKTTFPLLILNSDVPSGAETEVFAAVRVIRCGCGGQLPTPRHPSPAPHPSSAGPNFM